ncbi:hypothetical protein Cci01nite_52670 [Catellatospora citrea]|uniref:Uncharacterized protein n=1 Tax=Catellatospora citrea TaxID=53366 RepID=A0A8J3KMY1_9ACTN|nr:hypothetical protein Cci01nite_52670 [Catellatospora citrea]
MTAPPRPAREVAVVCRLRAAADPANFDGTFRAPLRRNRASGRVVGAGVAGIAAVALGLLGPSWPTLTVGLLMLSVTAWALRRRRRRSDERRPPPPGACVACTAARPAARTEPSDPGSSPFTCRHADAPAVPGCAIGGTSAGPLDEAGVSGLHDVSAVTSAEVNRGLDSTSARL